MTAKNNEGVIVTGGTVNIGHAAIGREANISVVVNESVSKANAVKDKPELREALKELCGHIAELTNKLSSVEQAKVCRDLESFVSEAASQAPRKSRYEISSKGLIEAAKAVTGFTTPVVSVVKTILGLLGS